MAQALKSATRKKHVTATVRAPVQARAKEPMASILEGARRVLEKQGYAALTTSAIAEAAGVGPGSLYEYFASKDAIVEALCVDYLGDVEKTFLRGFDTLGHLPLHAAVGPFVHMFFDVHLQRPRFRRAILEQIPARLSARMLQALDEHLTRVVSHYLGSRLPTRAPEELSLLAWTIVRAGRGITTSFLLEGKSAPTRDDAERALTRLVLRMLQAPRARPRKL